MLDPICIACITNNVQKYHKEQ